jgi:hypothetical protein
MQIANTKDGREYRLRASAAADAAKWVEVVQEAIATIPVERRGTGVSPL